MPANDRALYHITDPVTEITRGAPSSSEGSDGDKRFAYIPDRGLYHFVKHSGKWHSSAVYQEDISPLTKNGLQTENLTSKHDIRMAPARNVEIKEKKSMGTGEFTQGFTGNGWRLRHVDNEYNLEVDSMTVRGTLHVFEMLIQQLRATNGTVIIASAAKADSATSTTITFDDPSDHGVCPFAVNDIVMCQRVNLNSTTVVKRIVRRVTAVSGATITVVRDGDLPGDTATVAKGDDFVRIGNTTNTARQGGVLLTADMTNAPFIEIFNSVSSWATWTSTDKIQARLGQLKGIIDADANLDDDTKFGLYTKDVNLSGHIFSQSGEIAGWTLGNTTISKNNTELSSDGTLTLGTGIGNIIKLSSIDGTYRIWAGHTSAASAPFRVHKDGTLTATGADITGAVTITNASAVRSTLNVEDGASTDQTDAEIRSGTGWSHGSDVTKIDGGDIYADSVTAGAIDAGTITATEIASGTITATQINTSNITAAVVTTTSVNATTITADAINMDTATVSGTLAAGNIDVSGVVTANAVNAVGISASSISTGTMTAGAINMASGKAQINADGSAVFTDVAVTGTLTSNASSSFNSGTIAGFAAGGSGFSSDNISCNTDGSVTLAAGHFKMYADGDLYLHPSQADIDAANGGSAVRRGIIQWDTPNTSGNYWKHYHDFIDNDYKFLYNGSNQFIIGDNGVLTTSGTEFELGNTTLKLKSSTSATSMNIDWYSSDFYVADNDILGQIRVYVSDTNSAGYNASMRCVTDGTAGDVEWVWIAGNASTARWWTFASDGGSHNPLGGTTWDTYSDERVKENVTDISDALPTLDSLRPVTFNYTDAYSSDTDIPSTKKWGFIAQEFKDVIPEGVSEKAHYDYDDFHILNTDMLVPLLVKAVKELKAEVEQLKNSD